MPIKPDLRVHGKELEGLLRRVADLEGKGSIAFASSSASTSESELELSGLIADLSVRLEGIENQLADVETISPKKFAIKLGARMDLLDARLKAIEGGVKP